MKKDLLDIEHTWYSRGYLDGMVGLVMDGIKCLSTLDQLEVINFLIRDLQDKKDILTRGHNGLTQGPNQ